MRDFFNRYPVLTADGSHTFALKGTGEHYHSVHGAINESFHVFIREGLDLSLEGSENVKVLEIGFGTGLNALLSLDRIRKAIKTAIYHAVEPYPLSSSESGLLNFPDLVGNGCLHDAFKKMHSAEEDVLTFIDPGFGFRITFSTLKQIVLPVSEYDVVYHDAFAPWLQPDLWEEDAFRKLYKAMKPGGVLVTYCARGSVKRAMRASGFAVENPAGPPGKREMTRAVKPPDNQ